MVLTISHRIFLTKEQRYALHEGVEINVIGVSNSVWTLQEITSEPAAELFCKYIIKNTHQETPIKIIDGGYEITIPIKEITNNEIISNETWLKMTRQEKEDYYNRRGIQASSLNLLDMEDGGSECLIYCEKSKMYHNGSTMSVLHFIHIEDIKCLTDSIMLGNLEDS